MKIKHYRAADMRQALRQVREAQGPDAVILSSRRISGGVEVVAAVDYDAGESQVETYEQDRYVSEVDAYEDNPGLTESYESYAQRSAPQDARPRAAASESAARQP